MYQALDSRAKWGPPPNPQSHFVMTTRMHSAGEKITNKLGINNKHNKTRIITLGLGVLETWAPSSI